MTRRNLIKLMTMGLLAPSELTERLLWRPRAQIVVPTGKVMFFGNHSVWIEESGRIKLVGLKTASPKWYLSRAGHPQDWSMKRVSKAKD